MKNARQLKALLAGVSMRVLVAGVIVSAAVSLALDNTINNSFWDTTGYVNAATSSATSNGNDDAIETPLLSADFDGTESYGPFDSRWSSENSAELLGKFSSFRPGIILLLR